MSHASFSTNSGSTTTCGRSECERGKRSIGPLQYGDRNKVKGSFGFASGEVKVDLSWFCCSHLQTNYSKTFQRGNVDFLETPESVTTMLVPGESREPRVQSAERLLGGALLFDILPFLPSAASWWVLNNNN